MYTRAVNYFKDRMVKLMESVSLSDKYSTGQGYYFFVRKSCQQHKIRIHNYTL